jgi:CheY-like chemotaxis protein
MGDDKVRVLIVDDEYAFCKSLKLFLTKMGYEAIVATNGEHALDLIKEEQPQVMTLDIRMPGMDGYEVLNHAKRLNPELFIIVVTAVDVPRMEELLERSGAHAVLRKPVSLFELHEIIARRGSA